MKKIFTLFAAMMCAATMSFAQEDTREVVTAVSFTGFEGFFETGMMWNDQTAWDLYERIVPGEGTGYWWTATMQNLYKYNEETGSFDRVSHDPGTLLTPGKYYYEVMLRIEGDDALTKRLPKAGEEPTMTITVDGIKWPYENDAVVEDEYSYDWISSPEFTLEGEAEGGMCGDFMTWKLKNGVLTISGQGYMTDYGGDNGWAPWFDSRESIETIIVEDNIGTIGNYAFYQVTNVTSATIGRYVWRIGEEAFYECKNMASLTMGDRITEIEHSAFAFCRSLTSIELPDGVNTIGLYAFRSSGLTSVTIPSSVSVIKDWAFASCTDLTSLTLGDGVTELKESAFAMCNNLATITCEAITPPTCGASCFYDVDRTIPLYVPQESMEAYSEAPTWREFTNLHSIEELTPIDNVQSDKAQSIKTVRDGQLLIERGDKTFTVTGQEIVK